MPELAKFSYIGCWVGLLTQRMIFIGEEVNDTKKEITDIKFYSPSPDDNVIHFHPNDKNLDFLKHAFTYQEINFFLG